MLKLIAWGFCALGWILIGLTAGMIWMGKPYAIPHVVYVEQPIPHFLGGVACLFAWYVLRRGHRNTPREWAQCIGKFVMLMFSLGISLVIGEVGYRAILLKAQRENSFEKFAEDRKAGKRFNFHSNHPLALIIEPSRDSALVYELQPLLNTDFGHKSLRTNADGMRDDREYPVERAPNSVRIIGLGDSGMFGWNVEQNEDYMAVLEENLNARSNGILFEALNMGVPGYNTQLEAENLRYKGLKYKPDVVVVGWCINDYQLPFFMLATENFKRKDLSFLYTWMFDRGEMSNLIGGFRIIDHHDMEKTYVNVTSNMLSGTAIEGVAAAIKSLQEICQDRDIRLLVFGPMDEHVIGACRSLGIAYYNTLEKIRKDEYPKDWAVHFMHPRPGGHRVLAERLEQELARLGWLQPRPRSQSRAGN